MITYQQQANTIAQWYDALVDCCDLDPATFQLAQGGMVLGYTSESIWSIFDEIPGEAINHVYDPAPTNRFSTDYGAIIENLTANDSSLIKTARGMWGQSGGFGQPKAYNRTINDLNNVVRSAPKVHFHVGPAETPPDRSRNWAKGYVQVGDQVVLPSAPKPGDPSIRIEATFDHFATFQAGPLAQQSSEPNLANFPPWYFVPALAMAYDQKGIWGKYPTWNSTFGKQGNMLRRCVGLVVVDGLNVKICVEPSTEATAGIPVDCEEVGDLLLKDSQSESNEASSGVVTHLDPETGCVSKESPMGNKLLLGVNVMPAPQYITG